MSLFCWSLTSLLYGFLDLARPQAAGTDPDSLDCTVFNDLYALQIRVELSGSDIMSVRDRIAENRFFFTNIALHWHGNYSPHS